MENEATVTLICSWLSLGVNYRPNHYRLLGLTEGEENTSLIEQRCQERLNSVRRYQMKYPEAATEAMNWLAQAFVCLTEPNRKMQYDTDLLGEKSDSAITDLLGLPAVQTVIKDELIILKEAVKQRKKSANTRPLLPAIERKKHALWLLDWFLDLSEESVLALGWLSVEDLERLGREAGLAFHRWEEMLLNKDD